MPNKDAFAGMALSQQVSPPKLDQRLFEPTLPPNQPAAKSRNDGPKSSPTSMGESKPVAEPEKWFSPKKPVAVAPTPIGQFDLDDEALYKATFTFSQPELEALEDLKLQFRRDHDTKVTKNDLIRAALHLLLEDHATKKKLSYITRKLLKR